MIKNLIAFGCSFTYGDELLDPTLDPNTHCCDKSNDHYRNSHCYAGLVAQNYNLEFVNTAFPGASLESMRYCLHWVENNYDLNECMFIVGLTEPNRHSYFNPSLQDPPWNKFYHSTWLKTPPENDEHWYNLNKMWYMYCHHEDYEIFNLDQTIDYFEGKHVPTASMIIYKYCNYHKPAKTDCGFKLHETLLPEDYFPGGHPTEIGHKKVAQRLIEYIDRVKLLA